MRTEKKELNIQIGKRLLIARENSGYTQEAFAEALDVGVEHYRKIELGMYGLQRENMLILYKKYKIDRIRVTSLYGNLVSQIVEQCPELVEHKNTTFGADKKELENLLSFVEELLYLHIKE